MRSAFSDLCSIFQVKWDCRIALRIVHRNSPSLVRLILFPVLEMKYLVKNYLLIFSGFFEALRAEMDLVKSIGEDESPIKITIVCPPTVSTNLRKNSLTTDADFKSIKDQDALSPKVYV
jgi:hypothetical protein